MYKKLLAKNGLARKFKVKRFALLVSFILLFFLAGCATKGESPSSALKEAKSSAAKKNVSRQSKAAIGFYNLGREKMKRGDFSAAALLLEKSVVKDPKLFPAHAALGRSYEKLGKIKKARASFRLALTIRPGHAESRIALGRMAFTKGEVERALFHLEKAVESKPDSFIAQYRLGLIRRRRGQVSLAIHHFKRAMRISPGHQAARYWLWLSLTERGGAQAREVELGRAIVESGSDTPIRYYQGRAAKYFRRGHIGKALVAIQNAVDVNPNWRDKKWRSVLNDMARYRRAKKK
jgi:Tfp pilus assembly protein PilF